MPFFLGKFYAVTAHSVYEVHVKDLETSPAVRKMAFKGDKAPKVVPVGGMMLGGFYLAITNLGLIKYRVKRHQRAHMSPQTLRPRIEQLPRRSRAGKSFPLMGLFTKQDDADICLDHCSRVSVPEAFDFQWHGPTREVLMKIGHFHPLISLSTEGDFALPPALLPPNDHFGEPE